MHRLYKLGLSNRYFKEIYVVDQSFKNLNAIYIDSSLTLKIPLAKLYLI